MKQYYCLGERDSSFPHLPSSGPRKWSPFPYFETRLAKVLACTTFLLIVVVVLTASLVATGNKDDDASSRSSNAASVETSSETQTAPTGSPLIPPMSIPTTLSPISALPSVEPSTEPSVRETSPPTEAPTDRPSPSPTETLSAEPTQTQSSAPSHFPTTSAPTLYPTQAPVAVPNFRLKLHWEPDYFWQEQPWETRWCVECTTCPYLNFDETNCWCDIVPQCQVGNQIWIVDCDAGFGQIFTVRPVSAEYHQTQVVPNQPDEGAYYFDYYNLTSLPPKTVQPDLCWTRTETRFVTLQPCATYTVAESRNATLMSKEQAAQLFQPIPYDQYNVPFTISPAIALPKDNSTSWCLTNQHHPKTDEIVALKPCAKALEYHTGYWNVYPPAP